MGNVQISCCRSKSPRLQHGSNRGNSRNGIHGQYSPNNKYDQVQGRDYNNKVRQANSGQPSHILQHISEREPDDSETDPSSNPLNRPIFASRSRSNTKSKITESYSSSNNSNYRRQTNTPLTISQDHGYNSTTSTNLTHQDGPLIDSLDSHHRHSSSVRDGFIQNSTDGGDCGCDQDNSDDGNRLLLLSSTTSSPEVDKCSIDLFKRPFKEPNHLSNIDVRLLPQFCYNGIIKSSSCSTIFIDDSTISQPDLKQTMKCVSLAVYYHIKNRTSDNSAEIFDESIYPLKMPTSNPNDTSATNHQNELIILDNEDSLYDRLNEPDQCTIYKFVKTLFKAAQLTSEYAITTLVYLERLMTYAEMDLTPKTWRRMFLGAILLSSKVWEDQAVWNVDYAQILEEISVEDINELERQFLEFIQFNMNVPSSVYAKYYFHLRTLASKNGLTRNSSLLTVGKARILEATSRSHTTDWQSSPIHRKTRPVKKRHLSLERLRTNGQARAVLM